MESIETNKAVTKATGKRPFVLSRSTFPGSGVHTAHWTGDNAATWEDLSASIVTMNTLSLFGISMTGADICGFIGDTTEELCARWIEVGAFSPFSRDHNSVDQAPQELYRWESVTDASIKSLTMRYKLLPHLYTLMYQSSAVGLTVMNGLWMHFSSDLDAIATDAQYMWGDSLLFTPVLTEGATDVVGYFPQGVWYDLMGTGGVIEGPSSVTISTPLTETNIHVRGGSVIPMQEYKLNTLDASTTPYTLIIALDEHGSSSGSLYIDNGDGIVNEDTRLMDDYTLINYTYENNQFTSEVIFNQYQDSISIPIQVIEVWGLGVEFNSCVATVKGKQNQPTDYNMDMYSANKASMQVTDMLIMSDFEMSIECSKE